MKNYILLGATILLVIFNSCSNKQDKTTTPEVLQENVSLSDTILNTNPEQSSSSTNNTTTGYPEIVFETDLYDFGTIKEGEKVSYKFKFINKGSSDLVVKSVTPTCNCTKAEFSETPVKPGELGEITVTFDSNERPGPNTRDVSVITNSLNIQKIIQIKANVLERKN